MAPYLVFEGVSSSGDVIVGRYAMAPPDVAPSADHQPDWKKRVEYINTNEGRIRFLHHMVQQHSIIVDGRTICTVEAKSQFDALQLLYR